MVNNMQVPEYKVYFTTRAYTQLVSEVARHPYVETGGVFIGSRIGNTFYVFETLDPGKHAVRETNRFKQDIEYAGHLAPILLNLYDGDVTPLGYYHRHPGSFDHFTGEDMDMAVNMDYCKQFNGAISGLVNIDPEFRLQMWYVAPPNAELFKCSSVEVNDAAFENVMKLRDYQTVIRKIERQEQRLHLLEAYRKISETNLETPDEEDVTSTDSRSFLMKLKLGLAEFIGTNHVSTPEVSESVEQAEEIDYEEVLCQKLFSELEGELNEISSFARVTLQAVSDSACIVTVDRGAVNGEFAFLFSWNEKEELVLIQVIDGVESANSYVAGTLLNLIKENLISEYPKGD